MKRITLLLAALFLMLAAFPAIAADSQAAEEATIVESTAPAPEVETEGESLDLLPAALDEILTDPQPASCNFFDCRQSCKAGCSGGCFCFGFCNGDICECDEICP